MLLFVEMNLVVMDSQSILTIVTPFVVFGGVFVILLIVWDKRFPNED